MRKTWPCLISKSFKHLPGEKYFLRSWQSSASQTCSALYATPRFSTVFKKACHLSLSLFQHISTSVPIVFLDARSSKWHFQNTATPNVRPNIRVRAFSTRHRGYKSAKGPEGHMNCAKFSVLFLGLRRSNQWYQNSTLQCTLFIKPLE
jgi:hypothetical protein